MKAAIFRRILLAAVLTAPEVFSPAAIAATATFLDTPALLLATSADGFELQRAIRFIDNHGKMWTAPSRTRTDGASIPDPFVAIIGARTDERFLDAAIVHDAYCGRDNAHLPQFRSEPWEAVHRMFYEALITDGTSPIKAKIMYAAVYLGGPRWDDPERSLAAITNVALVQELRWCIQWIRASNPPLEKLEAWMRKRERGLQANSPVEPDWESLLNGPS